MHDSSKRHTLKLIGGSTAGVAIPSSLLAAEAATRPAGVTQFPVSSARTPELLINVLRTSAVPDNSVLLENTSDETLVISRFMPGTVVFDDVQVDLNEAAGSGDVILAPKQVISLRTKMKPVQSDDVMEYVWAESIAEPVSENLSLVVLGAFMADGKAIVFPHHTSAAHTALPA